MKKFLITGVVALISLVAITRAQNSIGGKTVGSSTLPSVIISDPNTASQYGSVLSVINARSLTGLFAPVIQGTHLLANGGGTYDNAISAPGTTGVTLVNTEGNKATCSAGVIAFTPVATPTDFAGIIGSATKTVRVQRIVLTGLSTAVTSVATQLIKRSTADTGSTPVDLTQVPNDSNNAACTAVFRTYTTTNPTTGTPLANVRAQYINLNVTGSAGTIIWDFSRNNDQALVLRGVAQGLFLNWNGVAVPAGTVMTMEFEVTEE